MLYRHLLRTATTVTELKPFGTDKINIRSEPEGENIFHRRKLSGSYLLTGDDFHTLAALEKSPNRCEELYLDMERLCSGGYVPEWQGVFSLNEVKWNFSKCQATITPRPNDAYRQIVDNYSKEHNVLQVPVSDSVSAKLDFDGQFEFLAIETGTQQDLEDPNTWAVFLEIRHWIQGNLTHKGHREKVDVLFRLVTYRNINALGEADNLNGWDVVDQEGNQVKYAKVPDLYNFKPYVWGSDEDFNKYPELKQIPCNAPYDAERYIQATDRCLNIRLKITQDRWMNIIWEFGKFYFNRNRKLLNVLQFLIQQVSPIAAPLQASELSEFFTSEINYVTEQPNKLINLLIAQRSDILSWNSSEVSTKGMLSLKSLLEDLRIMFDVHWFLNASGKFQIEHRAYFEATGTVDLKLPKYALYVAGKNAYEYMTEKMPRYQRLVFSNFLNEDFERATIEYSGACVTYTEGQDTDEKTVSRFTTDIEHLLTASGSDKNGFVLMVQENGEIAKEAGALSGQILVNGHLAATNLIENYWTYGRILYRGEVNNKSKVFKSILKLKKQVDLTVPACCGEEFGAFAEYITEVGSNGQLLGCEFNLKSQEITLSLAFSNEEAINNPKVPNDARSFNDDFNEAFR